MSMISSILPQLVSSQEQIGVQTGELYLQEAQTLPSCSRQRKLDFAAGRYCAHSALSQLRIHDFPILVGCSRQPLWPANVVGSITHCQGYSAAAVAHTRDWRGIGIDAEINAPLPAGTLHMIATAKEQSWIERAPIGQIHWDRLLFSLKESVYKVWYPQHHSWLGFLEVETTIDPATRQFSVELSIASQQSSLADIRNYRGSFFANESLILTAVIVD